jgi:hypothetical protein
MQENDSFCAVMCLVSVFALVLAGFCVFASVVWRVRWFAVRCIAWCVLLCWWLSVSFVLSACVFAVLAVCVGLCFWLVFRRSFSVRRCGFACALSCLHYWCAACRAVHASICARATSRSMSGRVSARCIGRH